METLKYKIITSEKQYDLYCKILYDMAFSGKRLTKSMEDEMDLITLLIKTWDNEHYPVPESDPVEMLKSIMEDHNMKAKDLAEMLGVTKGYVSGILNYKKGFSKEVVRKLANRFKMQQEAFNRPYELIGNKKKKRAA